MQAQLAVHGSARRAIDIGDGHAANEAHLSKSPNASKRGRCNDPRSPHPFRSRRQRATNARNPVSPMTTIGSAAMPASDNASTGVSPHRSRQAPIQARVQRNRDRGQKMNCKKILSMAILLAVIVPTSQAFAGVVTCSLRTIRLAVPTAPAAAQPSTAAPVPPPAAGSNSAGPCDPYKDYSCLDAYLGKGFWERLTNDYRLEEGQAAAPSDPKAPSGRR